MTNSRSNPSVYITQSRPPSKEHLIIGSQVIFPLEDTINVTIEELRGKTA